MMAYRAETAMANSFHEAMFHPDKARILHFVHFNKTKADLLLPDLEKQTLTIRLHH